MMEKNCQWNELLVSYCCNKGSGGYLLIFYDNDQIIAIWCWHIKYHKISWAIGMESYGQKTLIQNHSHWNIIENMCKFAVLTVPADGLALLGN